MNGFAFGGLSVASTKKSLAADLIQDIVQIDHTNDKGPYVLVLLDEYYYPDKLKRISIFLERNGIKNYKAVTSLNCVIPKEDLKGEISRFYRINQSKWKQHAEGAKGIIAVGAALYAINQSSDLMTYCFYDVMFNKSYFWSPDANTWVFPIDSFQEIFMPIQYKGDSAGMYHVESNAPINTYKTHFAEYQFKQITSLRLIPYHTEKPELITIQSLEEFQTFAKQHMKEKILSCDLETSGLDFMKNRIGCISFSFDGKTGYLAPWRFVDVALLDKMFETAEIVVGANFKFDVRFLWKNGVPHARIDEDTVQLGHVLNEQRFNGLKSHSFYYTPFGGYDRDLDRYREKTGIDDYLLIPEHILFPYATMDAVVTYLVYVALLEQIRHVDKTMPNEKDSSWTMERYYREVMLPAVNTFVKIEYHGVYTDRELLATSRLAMQTEIMEIENELAMKWAVGGGFDFNSSNELGKLFERLGFEDLGRAKNGNYKTSDASLERWAVRGHSEIKRLQRLRTLNTLLKTFISKDEDSEKGWENYIRSHDDGSTRMHPTFNVMRTESGRCRSDSPNMQNVPAGHGVNGDLATLVKKCITTPNPDEFYLSTLDYASLQMRLAAIDTNINEDGRDQSLYNIYTDPKMGGDMHSRTGFGVFAEGREFNLDVVEVEREDGTTKTYFGGEFVKTKNRGSVQARDLVATDSLV
jgi:DNA polymerase I-like protein with 3'-5' exonuclease and polymerase domains